MAHGDRAGRPGIGARSGQSRGGPQAQGQITLRGAGGVERVIPVDAKGYFYIDWCLPPNDPQLTQEPIQGLLLREHQRLTGQTNELKNRWNGKLVVVGSSATGNDLTDRGATPLKPDTLLASQHWNVANSIITGRFIHRAPLAVELALIALLGIAAALSTWKSRVLVASGLVALLAVAYVVLGFRPLRADPLLAAAGLAGGGRVARPTAAWLPGGWSSSKPSGGG